MTNCNCLNYVLKCSLAIGYLAVYRREKLEVKNKGTADEETVVTGFYSFLGEDEYKYFIRYTIDKKGSHIEVDPVLFERIPPSTLKSLVG